MNDTRLCNWVEATELAVRALQRAGAPEAQARTQAEHLVEAELRGRASHGLLRLPRLVERIHRGVLDPVTRGQGRWRGASFFEMDGERGFGPVVAYAGIEAARARARETGVAVVAIHNNNHLGMLALYAERLARQGQTLIGLSTSEALVHPWGGRHAMLGTNPIAIGVPAQPEPFVLDMATSIASMGAIHDHAHRGVPIPQGWALDGRGEPTTDAAAAKQGALAPFGQAKGYALGLAFEVLVASLTASALGTDVVGTLDSDQVCNKGDVFIIIEPAAGPRLEAVSAYLQALRACAPADPARPVLVPGDRAAQQRERAMQQGFPIAAEVWARIQALAEAPHSVRITEAQP
ncbi:putative oxidoreductase YjmC [Pigmentiphaga humi]|uniref:Putative oxidoreductase YjmC n=1 Tax=Pigmentiphaga humi TaxID=2478468 RepID=A0A3P4AZB3_9BURK|nr:Ldh family oxidoreductase [Pigmentiphaga humi]VCU69409.1 putative oxidoreductase YjmC [Pigmentiphaga humi]